MNCFAPFAKLWLSINWQKLNPTPSVTFAVTFIISFWFILVKDLFKLVFTIGAVLSATTSNVLFCFTLLLVSVAYIVKLITQVSTQPVIAVTLCICADAPDIV